MYLSSFLAPFLSFLHSQVGLGVGQHEILPNSSYFWVNRDGQLKKWRRLLHRWDNVLGSASCSDSDSVGGGSEKDLFGSEVC